MEATSLWGSIYPVRTETRTICCVRVTVYQVKSQPPPLFAVRTSNGAIEQFAQNCLARRSARRHLHIHDDPSFSLALVSLPTPWMGTKSDLLQLHSISRHSNNVGIPASSRSTPELLHTHSHALLSREISPRSGKHLFVLNGFKQIQC